MRDITTDKIAPLSALCQIELSGREIQIIRRALFDQCEDTNEGNEDLFAAFDLLSDDHNIPKLSNERSSERCR